MKKNFFIIILLVLVSGGKLIAQQDPLYSQYINNPLVINPAYAGFTNNLNVATIFRQQWAGFEGSPQTFNFNGHISLLGNKMGGSLMIVSDQIGSTTVNEALAGASYRIPLNNELTLSFGLQAGFANYKINNAKLNPQDPTDPLFEGESNEFVPQFGAGAILSNDRFFLGFSMPRMLKNNFNTGTLQSTLYNQHFYAMGSYIIFLSERIRLRPSALVKVVKGAPLSVDLNAAFIIHENYQVGALTRNGNTYGLFGQLLWKDKFRLGYVFEIPTGKSVGTQFTSHEITLGVRFNALSFHSNTSVFSF